VRGRVTVFAVRNFGHPARKLPTERPSTRLTSSNWAPRSLVVWSFGRGGCVMYSMRARGTNPPAVGNNAPTGIPRARAAHRTAGMHNGDRTSNAGF
jgi:hypothetical protein